MYHYVRDGDARPPYGYYHLDSSDFRRQLDYFQDNYHVLGREAFLATLRGDRDPRGGDVVLTFDDGLKDHHANVLPELVERDLWGLFYVSSGPYRKGKVLDVHRIHALLGAHGGEVVAETLVDSLDETMVSAEHREQFSDVVYVDQDNTGSVDLVKRLLNYYVDENALPSVLDSLERQLFGSPPCPSDVYMTRGEIRELVESGMHVGSHASTHTVMSKLSREEQEREISNSFEFLTGLLGDLPIRSYCHPYGGSHSYTDETLELLGEAGCSFAFDVDSRPITKTVIGAELLTLPRYDCNEFPHGRSTASLG